MGPTNPDPLVQRCEETLARLAHMSRVAETKQTELRLQFSMQCCVSLLDTRPAASDAAAFARRVLEGHLDEAQALVARAACEPALAAA